MLLPRPCLSSSFSPRSSALAKKKEPPSGARAALLRSASDRARRLRLADQDHFDRTRHSLVVGGHEIGHVKPTAETERRLRPDTIARLVGQEALTVQQGRAALEIREVYETIAGGLFGRASDLADRHRGGRREPSDRIATLHARRYLPWARQLGGAPAGPPPAEATPGRCRDALQTAIDVAVFGYSLAEIDAAGRWRKGRGLLLLTYALAVYCEIAGTEREPGVTAALEVQLRISAP
jgi:hypothetical protein